MEDFPEDRYREGFLELDPGLPHAYSLVSRRGWSTALGLYCLPFLSQKTKQQGPCPLSPLGGRAGLLPPAHLYILNSLHRGPPRNLEP